MIDTNADLYSRLLGDAGFAAMLAGYGDQPALFSENVPSDIIIGVMPVGIISAPIASTDADTFTEEYRYITHNLRLYHKPEGTSLVLHQAAETARRLIKNWPAGEITGGHLKDSTVSGPAESPTDDPALEGRLLNVRLYVKET